MYPIHFNALLQICRRGCGTVNSSYVIDADHTTIDSANLVSITDSDHVFKPRIQLQVRWGRGVSRSQ